MHQKGKKTMVFESCEYCGGNVKKKRIAVDYRYHGELVVIKDVPVGVCQDCGERYYDASVIKVMEKIAKTSDKIKNRISVPITSFEQALVGV